MYIYYVGCTIQCNFNLLSFSFSLSLPIYIYIYTLLSIYLTSVLTTVLSYHWGTFVCIFVIFKHWFNICHLCSDDSFPMSKYNLSSVRFPASNPVYSGPGEITLMWTFLLAFQQSMQCMCRGYVYMGCEL